jgi:hypothetical protein
MIRECKCKNTIVEKPPSFSLLSERNFSRHAHVGIVEQQAQEQPVNNALLSLSAFVLSVSVATANAQSVGGPLHHGTSAPSQQTRTMSTPRTGGNAGAGSVGGPHVNAGTATPAHPTTANASPAVANARPKTSANGGAGVGPKAATNTPASGGPGKGAPPAKAGATVGQATGGQATGGQATGGQATSGPATGGQTTGQ